MDDFPEDDCLEDDCPMDAMPTRDEAETQVIGRYSVHQIYPCVSGADLVARSHYMRCLQANSLTKPIPFTHL